VAHLFQPLRTTRASQGGTGLGLSSVKALAEQDGAVVAVHSAPGKGTTVTVVYPAAVAIPRTKASQA
jgi:signal transduction histidine kinase